MADGQCLGLALTSRSTARAAFSEILRGLQLEIQLNLVWIDLERLLTGNLSPRFHRPDRVAPGRSVLA